MTSFSAPRTDGSRQQIVVGYDGSAPARAAVHTGIGLAEALGADLLAITTWTYPITFGGFPLSGWSQEQEARELLGFLTDDLFPAGTPDWFTSRVSEGDAATVLMRASADAPMLVVGSRGHGGFAGLLLGSVSTECAANAECPVLVVRHEPTAMQRVEPSAAATVPA